MRFDLCEVSNLQDMDEAQTKEEARSRRDKINLFYKLKAASEVK